MSADEIDIVLPVGMELQYQIVGLQSTMSADEIDIVLPVGME
jgi:deoxyribose-phosphate aldolase